MVLNMKKFKTLALAAAVSTGLLASSGVMAAFEDGELQINLPSEGWFDIFLYNNAQAKIWGLDDIEFLGVINTSSAAEKTKNMDVCVWTNTSDFRMTVASANNFTLQGGSENEGAKYTVTIADAISGVTPTKTAVWGDGNDSDDALTEFLVGTSITDHEPDCGTGGAVRNVNVKIDLTSVTAVTPGAFSDRVTLTVTPI